MQRQVFWLLVAFGFLFINSCEKPDNDNNSENQSTGKVVYTDTAAVSDLGINDVNIEPVPDTESETFCVPGERTCSFNDVLICKMDGSDYAFLKTCQSGCENGDCIEEVERQDPVLYDDLDFWPEEYAVSGLTWDHSPVTYCFESYTSDLNENQVKSVYVKAFDLWADYIEINFVLKNCNTSPEPDIKIRFGAGDHGGCQFSFDGAGGVLAHAWPPSTQWLTGGDAHFDETEKWEFITPMDFGEIDLISVAAHEIGHALGLKHSGVATALMYPYYNGEHRYLDQDDIDGIQAIYPDVLSPPCYDGDNDGYGMNKTGSCPKDKVDCNDNDVSINPDAKELCDKKDNDCDSQIDEDQNQWNKNCGICTDTDGDGYGKTGTKTISCLYSNKYDCNDSNSDVYPGAIEFCDSLDNDCDGTTDEDPSFYNNCGKCGPDEISVGSPCGKCGIIKCKPEGGVMCEEPCPQGQSCCGSGCMPDGGDCCTEKGLWEGSCSPDYKCIPGGKCVLKNSVSCGNDCYCNSGEACCHGYCAPNGYYCCPDLNYLGNCYQKGICLLGFGCSNVKYQFPWIYLFCCSSPGNCEAPIELYQLPKQICPTFVEDIPVFPGGCI